MKTKFVTLCENRVEPSIGLKTSHGFSLYIEYNDIKILYDTGQDDCFISNANLLNIDINDIDYYIISHGHFDHAGGLKYIDKNKLSGKIIIDKHAFEDKYRITEKGNMDIGISLKLDNYKELSSEINKSFKICDGLWCIANVNLNQNYIGTEKGLIVIDKNGKHQNDFFEDEINLAIEMPKGLYIISGCSHRGVINIIKEAQKITGVSKVDTFIGGMHLSFSSKEQIKSTINELKKMNIHRFIIGHCTGWEAINAIHNELGNNSDIINNFVGFKFD